MMISMGLAKLQTLNIHDPEWSVILKQIVEHVCQLDPHCDIYAFGSFAKNMFTAGSDLDIAIIIPDSTSAKDFNLKIRAGGPIANWPMDLVVINKSRYEERKLYGGVCFEINDHGIQLYPKWSLVNVSTEK